LPLLQEKHHLVDSVAVDLHDFILLQQGISSKTGLQVPDASLLLLLLPLLLSGTSRKPVAAVLQT
jgi:hypothetical protein